jgi:STE24 endopeptidase
MSLVIGFLAPIVFAPLFFRFKPLSDETLRDRFRALAEASGVPVIGVFVMAASAKTRRSNAAVVGFGRTRRIVITDTMIERFTPEEIETVLAHELGHQRNRDPLKGLVVGALVSLVMLGISASAYSSTYSLIGLSSPTDVAGLPLLAAFSGLVSLALGPAELAWSRRRESRADDFALEVTKNPVAFASAMVKLHDQNLAIAHPARWERLLAFTHPSGRERVETARRFAARSA